MLKSNKIKTLLQELNKVENKQNYEKEKVLIEFLLKELIGDTIPGVTYELVNNMRELINSSSNIRLVSFEGSIYLTDVNDIAKIYSGNVSLIPSYLKLTNGLLDIVNCNKRTTYNLNRTYNLKTLENKNTCYIESEMFYNFKGLEYSRVQKISSFDDSYVPYLFVTCFDRIDMENVRVSGRAYIGKVNGLEPFEYLPEPYNIKYDGVNLDIDVNKIGYEAISKAVSRNKQNRRRK